MERSSKLTRCLMEKLGYVFMRECTGRGRWVPWPQAWDPRQELTWEGPSGVQALGEEGGRLNGVGGQAEVGSWVTSLLSEPSGVIRRPWEHGCGG